MEPASKRRAILLLAVATILVVTASASVKPVAAAPSVSPSPTWNKIVNGDFDQGVSGWSLYTEGHSAANSWSVYDDSNRGDYPSDDANYLWLQSSCYASDWATTVASQGVSVIVDPYLTFYATIRIEAGMILSNAGVRLRFQYYTSGSWHVVGWICYDDNYNTGWTYVTPSDSCYTYAISSYGNTWIGVDDGVAPGRSVYNDFNTAYPGYLGNYQVRVSLVECYDYAHGNIFVGQTTYAKFDGIRLGDYPPTPSVSIPPVTAECDTSGTTVTYQWSFGDVPSLLCGDGYQLWLRDGIKYQFNAYVDGVLFVSYGDITESSSWKDYPVTMSAKGEYTAYITARVLIDSHAPWVNNTYFSKILNGYSLTVQTSWNYVPSASQSATLHYYQHGNEYSVSVSSSVTRIVDPSSNAWIVAPSVSGTYRRVDTASQTSWNSISSELGTQTVSYYLQYEAKWSPSGLGGGYSTNVYAMQDGSWVTYSSKRASFDVWVDACGSTNLKMNDTVTVAANKERYHAPTSSWTVSISSPYNTEYTANANFIHQWKPTVTISGLPDSSHWVNATYTRDAAGVVSPNWWTGAWSDWVDDGKTLTFSLNSALSTSSERWRTYSVRSWTVSSAFSGSVTYVHQYYVSLDPMDEFGNPLGRSVSVQYTGDDGSGSSNGTYTTTFSSAWSRWINYGTTLRNGKLASGSSLTDQWYSYNGTLNGNWRERTVSSSVTYTLMFYHQLRSEIELYSTLYGQKVYDNSWYLSPYDWIQASAYLAASDTHTPIVGTYTFTFTDPSGVPHAVDGSATGSCFYRIPQARGAWTLRVTWDDGSGVVFNKTVPFYVWDYDVGFQSLVQSGNNLNLTVYVNQLSGTMSIMQDYGYVVAVTGGSGSGIYTNATGFTFANGFMSVGVSSVSTRFFFPAGMWTWSAHMINLDPYLAHVVGMRVLVVDPLTGYIYVNATSTKSLAIGGESDITAPFSPSPSWYRYGLFRVYHTFLLYDVSGATLLASKTVDYRNSSPLSWIMSGTGEGDIKSIYYFTGLHNSTTLTQIPVSLLAPYTTGRFYVAFEDSHALSTQSQVSPAVMHYMNITFTGGNVFATGCVPPSTWVAEGNVNLSVDSPFYPKPPYYSNTTRFIFLGWKWTYTSSYPQWASCNSTTLIVDVTQPIQVVAYWRTQYLIEYTPYVPTTAPTDTVEVSYTANATLTTMSVKSASTVRVWVDAYTLFTMKDLWINDYTWYGVNYDTPSKNVTGGASLTLPYVEKTNKVSNTTVESNNFEAGGTLNLNLTITTTYFNAQWINVTVMVASENAILVDRNGATWSNMRIQLQNNTAVIRIPLPHKIGNGTLTVILTAYGKVEPTTKQVTLRSPLAPPGQGQQQGGVDLMPIAVTVTSLGGLLGASLFIRKWRRTGRQDSDHSTSNATTTTTTTASTTGFNFAPIIDSLSGAGIIEFHEQRGPHLKTIIDKGSKFLSKLRGEPGMCVRHHGTRPLVIQDPEGEHVALLTYTNNSRGRGHEAAGGIEVRGTKSRTAKSTLVLCAKERSGTDIMKLAEELSQLGNSRSIRLKLVSTIMNRNPPPTRRNPSNSTSPTRHNVNHG